MSVYRAAIPGSWSSRVGKDPNYFASWFHSIIVCNNKMSVFTKNRYLNLLEIKNKRLYSNLIRSLYLDIDMKKSIIGEDMGNIDIKDKILWSLLFKRPYSS
jgi:hypothetical protein